MPEEFERHCQRNPRAGPDVALEADELLGHVKPEQRTIENLAKALRLDPSQVATMFKGLAGELAKIDNDLATELFQEEVVRGVAQNFSLARGSAWLFRTQPAVDDPFLCDVECLPWNLGLPNWADLPGRTLPTAGLECIGFRVPAAAVAEAKLPTIFDAGYEGAEHYWFPGGKTVPHPHRPSSCSGPVDEIVAVSPMLRQVSPEFVRFTSKVA